MKITDPLIELLAIKLFEHDRVGVGTGSETSVRLSRGMCWANQDEEDREIYRRMARGETELYGDE